MPQPRITSIPGVGAVALPAVMYGFRYTREPSAHPMNAADGHWMWDASGAGCIDGGDWDDPFPDAKGEERSPAFCVPQPCARLLSPDELSTEVYGRALRPGEYDTYLRRLEESCGEIPVSPLDMDAELDLEDLLHLAGFDLVDVVPSDMALFQSEDGETEAGTRSPSSASGNTVNPSGSRDHAGLRPYPGFGGWPGGGASSGGNRKPPPDFQVPSKFEPSKPGKPGDPDKKPGGSGSTSPVPPTGGDPGGSPGGDSNPPQPAPVPVPGGLALLMTGLATLFAGRRASRRAA